MRVFKKKVQQTTDPLDNAKTRDELIDRLRDRGYFIRRQTIRRPKVGDTIRFYVSAGWKMNTYYYQTGVLESVDDYGNMTVVTRNRKGKVMAIHGVRALQVIKVSKTKSLEPNDKKKR